MTQDIWYKYAEFPGPFLGDILSSFLTLNSKILWEKVMIFILNFKS
jgi:hypothetical protein